MYLYVKGILARARLVCSSVEKRRIETKNQKIIIEWKKVKMYKTNSSLLYITNTRKITI
jgi:hypothetical protein